MHNIETAITAIQASEFVILQDDEDRENEADLIIAAQYLTAEKLNFMLHEAGGFICLALTGEILDRLQIPQMVEKNQSQYHTPFTISVEASHGITTGVSVADRLHTIKTIIADNTTPDDIVMPGHIFPLRASKNGVFNRRGHTEGSVDLMKLAKLKGAALICELMNKDGTMMRGAQVRKFADQYDFKITSISDISTYRLQKEARVTKLAQCQLPIIDNQIFNCAVYQDHSDDKEHVVLSSPKITSKPLVRIHSKCLTGDVLQSKRCDCGEQLQFSLQIITKETGILFYLDQEGRGIGLANKIKSYHLQQQGYDSVEANHQLGFADDLREYSMVAAILHEMKVTSIRLLTNNPRKVKALQTFGIDVERIALPVTPNPNNKHYLLTKQKKLDHLLGLRG